MRARLLWLFAALWHGGAMFAMAETNAPPGDPVRGEQVYQRCLACHALTYNRVGPRHCGVIGRRAGSVPGFQYSPAMSATAITWTPETLDAFLTAPTRYVPGTTMSYAGVDDAVDRRDLIAFLAAAANDPARCPSTTTEGLP